MNNLESKEVVNKTKNMKERGDNKNEERQDPGVAEMMNINYKEKK